METANAEDIKKETDEAKTVRIFATFVTFFNDTEKMNLIKIPNKNYIATLLPGNLKLLADSIASAVIIYSEEDPENLKILESLTIKIYHHLMTYQADNTSHLSRGVNTAVKEILH